MSKVVLTGKGRRWSASGHPWIYRDDLASIDAESGALVAVEDPAGRHVGWGLYSASSRIAVRLCTRGESEPTRAFWKERVERAFAHRRRHALDDPRGACRWIAGDADGVPGLVVDRYGDVCVLQSGAAGSDRLLGAFVELIEECAPFPIGCVVERSDASVRKLEELEPRVGVLRGELPRPLVVREDVLEYEVDVLQGHKTGHYLDQRENRRKAAFAARGQSVLDVFCYDGLFGVRAALAGAERVVCIDQSAAALERTLVNAERNGVRGLVSVVKANALDDLRERERQGEHHGLVIVDPPAFARNRREIAGAERGYVELNRRALALLDTGGMLVSASCSYNVLPAAFVGFLSKAAALAGRAAFLEELGGAAADHPHLLTLPETHYLKCAFVRVG